MSLGNLSDLHIRLISVYLAQFLVSLMLAFIFFYFGRIYQRYHLNMWSASWVCFCFAILAITFLTIGPTVFQFDRKLMLFISMITLSCNYLQLTFLSIGTYELIKEKKPSFKQIGRIIGATVFLALISVLVGNGDPDGAQLRYFLRIGFKACLVGLIFIFSGILTLTHRKFTKSMGQRVLGSAFTLYGLQHMLYFGFVINNIFFDTNVTAPPGYFGIIDLVLLSLMGIGMIMWLLEDERAKLEKTNKELDNFIYSTSHDLRAPIASILGIINIVKKDIKEEMALKYNEMVEGRILKLDEVINDILTLSRSAKAPINIELINFNQLLEQVISDVKFNKGAKKIRLVFNDTVKHQLYSDYSQLKAILNNLISNAVKYHNPDQDDPYIEVDIRKQNNSVRISIKDNGQGIDENSRNKIFDMFYRASESAEGSGLGLYIVKEAINRLGGKIEVYSKKGHGSSFEITLNQPSG